MGKKSTKSTLTADLDRLLEKFAAVVMASESIEETKKHLKTYQREFLKIKSKHK